ncbi:MAG: multiheme c-type cytochrome [Gemmataceae bacterium]|nr:cytochrome c family protein [Gemmata sp.]MDW8195972.1 multiheme c-type cytochrome [Gemmataceae bacterium]
MNPIGKIILLALMGFFATGLFLSLYGKSQPVTVVLPAAKSLRDAPVGPMPHQPVGMAGCLGAACHGGPAERTLARQFDEHTWQSSGSCWAAADPHSTAYSLLTDQPLRPVRVTAQQIMERYAPGKKATEEVRCLACHTNPTLARPEFLRDAQADLFRREGVGCEACHGNASGWINSHTTWNGDRSQVYAQTGMTPLFDLGERAMTCLGCHVGAPAEADRGLPVRDMNHDMIAAGHPRLNFDFAEYLRRLPRHWHEKDRPTNAPRILNPAKVWYVGRYAHAEAACRLLADRAQRSADDPQTPWPEFAEFDCASCHHHLHISDRTERSSDWRKSEQYLAGRRLGAPRWQLLWPVGTAPGLALPQPGESPLAAVAQIMETAPRPRASVVHPMAIQAAQLLRNRRIALVATPDTDVQRTVQPYLASGGKLLPDWDSAQQLYYGLAAFDRAEGDYSEQLLKTYQSALAAFRNNDWNEVEKALEAIRKSK